MNKNFKLPLMFCTLIVAACSILYELLLAQTLSTTMGNTILRYNITVGLYMASLGVGALIYSKIKISNLADQLVKIELCLTTVGGLFPILVLVFEYTCNYIADNTTITFGLLSIPISLFNHLLIIIIGLLSGFELPLLMEMGKSIENKLDLKVLVVDYLGTLIGIIIFPNMLLPTLGLFTISFLIATLNALVATYLVFHFNSKLIYKVLSIILLIVGIICLINHDSLSTQIIERLYLNG